MLDLLLIALPWARPDHMSIQLATLKAMAARDGHQVAARHYYKDIAGYVPITQLSEVRRANAGELLCLPALHPEQADAVAGYVRGLLGGRLDIAHLRRTIDSFLEDVLADILRIATPGRTVIGFSTSLQQIVTSLVLAARLKEKAPSLLTLFGGAVLLRENTEELLRRYPQVNYAIYGEGEDALVAFLRCGPNREPGALAAVPNLAYRSGGKVVTNPPSERVNLTELPVPDYDDWFLHTLRRPSPALYPKVSIETARGCFYDKCEFCNLNAQWLARYRAKSDARVYDEVRTQTRRYRTNRILFVDTNVSNRGRLFRSMAEDPFDYHGWAEVSGHLKRSTFLAMRRGGLSDIQIGIESFAPAFLQRLRKGVSAMRNMEMLKWCAELGITLHYNLLIQYPGETHQDVEDTVRAMRFARHFQPPVLSPFVLTIASPLERAMRKDGTVAPIGSEPKGPLASILPREVQRFLAPLLSAFVGETPSAQTMDWTSVEHDVETWRARFERNRRGPGMVMRRGDGFVVVTERDGDEEEYTTLQGEAAEVFLACADEACTASQIHGATELDADVVQACLDGLEEAGLVFASEGQFLALACREDTIAAAASREEKLRAICEHGGAAQARLHGTEPPSASQ